MGRVVLGVACCWSERQIAEAHSVGLCWLLLLRLSSHPDLAGVCFGGHRCHCGSLHLKVANPDLLTKAARERESETLLLGLCSHPETASHQHVCRARCLLVLVVTRRLAGTSTRERRLPSSQGYTLAGNQARQGTCCSHHCCLSWCCIHCR